jgi:hypothetical protein
MVHPCRLTISLIQIGAKGERRRVEGLFCWYWVSDLCEEHRIAFVLGHAQGWVSFRDLWIALAHPR